MPSDTNKLIRLIGKLFTEESKRLLEYTIGGRLITIEKQLNMRFGNMYPSYDLDFSLDLAADIIRRNSRYILIIGKEFDEMDVLSQPLSFSKTLIAHDNVDRTNKNITLTNEQGARETIARTKNRGGAATRSFDNIEEEQRWEKEDDAASLSSISLSFNTVTIDKAENAKIVQSFKENIKTDNYNLELDKQKEYKYETLKPEEGRYLNSIEISTGRNKVFNKQIQNALGYADRNTKEIKRSTHTTGVPALNILNVFNTDVSDVRDKFFNQFYILFSYYPSSCL